MTDSNPSNNSAPDDNDRGAPTDFIRAIIEADLRTDTHGGRVATRFPPEPNGYLHIGHAKSICLNFGIAEQYDGGTCNLRFDDTNPAKEDVEYVDSIQADIRWLGFDFGEALFASDYFERMYQLAEGLIRDGKAYVCSLDEAATRAYRGSLTEPGRPSPDRDRPIAENLDLFRRMRAGEFPDGALSLRAKIDMAARNMKMRDPLLYRIRHIAHHRAGDAWCIYPMYDYAHPLEDVFEDITHSICTLEFENNRAVYDWVIDSVIGSIIDDRKVDTRPRQYEFARLALEHTIMSKRKLLQLVEEGHVTGWDDPRMPTIAGMRRRGYSPEAIRAFCDMIGVAKNNSSVDMGKLEYSVRNDLNYRAPRVMCVLDPVKVVLTNYEADGHEELDAPYFPADIGKPGSRMVRLSREIYIEADDFAEAPPKKYRRLAPGRVIRLRYAYCIRCDEVVKDDDGNIVELRCTYFPGTIGGQGPEGEKVWGVIHWVAAAESLPATVRLYDRLFTVPKPDAAPEGKTFLDYLNPDSLRTIAGARVEPSVGGAAPGARFQFTRLGYFAVDPVDSSPDALVFNRIVGLRDTWAGTNANAAADTPAPAATPNARRTNTRPGKRSGADIRGAARAASEDLTRRFERYQSELALSEARADLLTSDLATAQLFEAAHAVCGDAELTAKWIINELPRELGDLRVDETKLTGDSLGALLSLMADDTITAAAGKEVLGELVSSGGDAQRIVKTRGLAQLSDASAIEAIVREVLDENAGKVAAYRAGKTGLLGFFVGQVMKRSGGRAKAAVVRAMLETTLA